MNPALIRLTDVAPQPWRNGGGMTREVLAWPATGKWRARISVADVERDGPFSHYAGVLRWFAVLAGAGVELTIDGAVHRMTSSAAPVSFSGAATTTCRLLGGPTRDLNLMLRDAHGSMSAVEGEAPWQPQARACGLFAAVAGTCRYDRQHIEVPAESLLWFASAPTRLAFDTAGRAGGATGWWITVSVEQVSA